MEKKNKTTKEFLIEIEDLRIRLEEVEETLCAIRRGEVDGLVVSGAEGDRVYTLEGADRPYRFFVESMSEGAVTLSFDGTVLYCNDRFAEMVETSCQKIIGDSIYRFISSREAFETAFQEGKTAKIKADILIQGRNSKQMPVSVSFNPLQENEVPGICMVVSDLTEHVRQKELLKERAGQLARLSSELTLAEQRERSRIAEILHDHLQQLLVGARISQELLIPDIDDSLKPDAERVLHLVSQSILGMRSLSSELSPPILRSGDFTGSLQWLAKWMYENQGLEVDFQCEDRIVLDRKEITVLLFQSVRELLLNVLKHSGMKYATLAMKYENGDLRITVRDRGKGFDPEAVWANATSDQRFGLITIRERLLHLGGRFEIESTPDAGSAVSLIVSLDGEGLAEEGVKDPERESRAKLVSEIPAGTWQTGDKVRVMIVDDHSVMRQGLSTMLGLQSDIEMVGEAPDGEQAVQLAREIVPDVILMDVSMPNMNGMEATRIIHSEFPHIRIVGLSMYDADD